MPVPSGVQPLDPLGRRRRLASDETQSPNTKLPAVFKPLWAVDQRVKILFKPPMQEMVSHALQQLPPGEARRRFFGEGRFGHSGQDRANEKVAGVNAAKSSGSSDTA